MKEEFKGHHGIFADLFAFLFCLSVESSCPFLLKRYVQSFLLFLEIFKVLLCHLCLFRKIDCNLVII